MKQMLDVQTGENHAPEGAKNRASGLPVNLPDTSEIRGVASPFPENSGQNASEGGGKWKTGEGLIVRPWTVTVAGFGHGDYIARSRGKALAKAWQSSAFEGWTFGEFLKRATCRMNRVPWERFGNRITVAGEPAFLMGANKQYVEFVRPGSDVVMNAHPFDVQDENGEDWPYWAKRPPGLQRSKGGE